ncbi:N-6 DNA methylase [Chromobacterium vaccinii]|uniref:N-6 DNA methylase n=1 Tax=Chromobacterium vaccinii TaxID=1108595 RepID=UPI003458FD1E
MSKRLPASMHACQHEFIRLIRENSRRHRLHEVFRDFCEMSALAISNAIDRHQFEAREARYMQIIKRYDRDEAGRFPVMLSVMTEGLAATPHDFLGAVFMALELFDNWKGQFFTATELCKLISRLNCGPLDIWRKAQDEGRFISMHEPAVGAGAMIIAHADMLMEEGINYQQVMHVEAWDVDATAVHMAYIQFSLLHIPAVIVQGNTLTLERRDTWLTPAHILGGWARRLAARASAETEDQSAAPRPLAEVEPLASPQAKLPLATHRPAEQLALF